MIRETSLPQIFAQYTPLVSYIQQHSATEWSSSCPACKGDKHDDGSLPDRCRWFTSGKSVGWCRRCGSLFWPDKAPDYKPPTPAELEYWRIERVKAEQERKRSAERAIENLRSSRIWEQYHKALNNEGREYWRQRGIPDSLQNYWKLGWVDEYMLQYAGNDYMGQSATIPIFGAGWQPLNVKHRLLHLPGNIGKYRYELRGQQQPVFLTNPDAALDGQVFVIEGEIKAMVTWLTLADRNTKVVGLPGITPSNEALTVILSAERVTLVLDPGADDAALRLANIIGIKKCRVLIPPMKIDDAIMAINPSKTELANLLATAQPIGG
jgi:hypothetical protein